MAGKKTTVKQLNLSELPYADKNALIEERKKIENYLLKNRLIIMSIDPGYDSFKVYLNGEFIMSVPSLTLLDDKTENISLGGESNDLIIDYKSTKGYSRYLIGESARKQALYGVDEKNQKILLNSYTDERRFSQENFIAGFLGIFIGTLIEYAEQKNCVGFSPKDIQSLENWNIKLTIPLPHEYKESCAAGFKEWMMNEQSFEISYKSYRFQMNLDFKKVDITFCSQVLSAYQSLLYTINGGPYNKEHLQFVTSLLDTLMLDAGYHTLGQTQINQRGNVITPGSNINYSMELFDSKVIERIQKEYGDRLPEPLNLANISDYCQSESLYAKKEKGIGMELVPVAQYREEIISQYSQELSGYLQDNFHFSQIHSIFICGGTGKSLYSHLKEYFNPADFENIKSVLLLKGFLFKDKDLILIGPEYAVAYGAFTKLLMSCRKEH